MSVNKQYVEKWSPVERKQCRAINEALDKSTYPRFFLEPNTDDNFSGFDAFLCYESSPREVSVLARAELEHHGEDPYKADTLVKYKEINMTTRKINRLLREGSFDWFIKTSYDLRYAVMFSSRGLTEAYYNRSIASAPHYINNKAQREGNSTDNKFIGIYNPKGFNFLGKEAFIGTIEGLAKYIENYYR